MFEYGAKKWGVVVGAGILATFGFLSSVSGELVFDDQSPAETAGRENLRNEVAGDGVAAAPVPQPAAIVVQAPAAQAAQPTVVVQTSAPVAAPAEESVSNLSRAELIRRSRMREELKNEDILQTRLEELRLRDEQRRTGQLLGDEGAAGTAPVPVTQGLTETVVVSPVTERPGEPAPLLSDQLVTSQAAPAGAALAPAPAPAPREESGEFTITGKGGLSNMVGNNAYNIQSRFTAGVGAGVGVSENIEFEIGYAYSEYGVAINSTNPFVQYAQSAQFYGASYYPAATAGQQAVFETIVAKQNVVDGGLKIKLLGADSKLRPFLGGGAGYSKAYVNYDQRFLDWMRNSPWYVPGQEDYQSSSFLGYLTTGFDLSLSRNVAVGANFRYYTVLTARENQSLNNMAFMPNYYGSPYSYGYGGYGGYATTANDADKQSVGGSLARSGFYSILAGVTFKF